MIHQGRRGSPHLFVTQASRYRTPSDQVIDSRTVTTHPKSHSGIECTGVAVSRDVSCSMCALLSLFCPFRGGQAEIYKLPSWLRLSKYFPEVFRNNTHNSLPCKPSTMRISSLLALLPAAVLAQPGVNVLNNCTYAISWSGDFQGSKPKDEVSGTIPPSAGFFEDYSPHPGRALKFWKASENGVALFVFGYTVDSNSPYVWYVFFVSVGE